jgi:signal transduction histidine kinase/ligand-binding sensor domain-containing protein
MRKQGTCNLQRKTILRLTRWAGLITVVLLLDYSASAAEVHPSSKEYLVDSWSTENGLPQNTILSITQTRDGYLWLATFNGLVRFDGVRFTVFNPVNTPALPSGRILEVMVDRHGWLWIFSEESQLTRMAGGHFEAAAGHWGLPNSRFAPNGIDPEGNLWMHEVNTPVSWRWKGDRFVPADYLESFSDEEFKAISAGAHRGMWLERGGDWNGLRVDRFRDALVARGGARPSVFGRSRRGDVWVVTETQVETIHGRSVYGFGPGTLINSATDLAESLDGTVFLATWTQGLFALSAMGGLEKVSLGPVDSGIRVLFMDAEGNLWVGNDVAGLFRLRRRIFRNLTRADGLGGAVMKSIAESIDGNLWVANQGGLDRLSPDGTAQNVIKSSDLWSLARNSRGELWVGSFGGGLWQVQENPNSLRPCQAKGGDRPTSVRVLAPSRQGGLWLGATDGLWEINGAELSRVDLPAELPARDVRAIVEDSAGRLCLGLYGGGLLCRENGHWSRYGKKHGLADEQVLCLYADKDDSLWVGSVFGGLSRFKDGRFVNFQSRNLPISGLVSCVIEDDLGFLWLGGLSGIQRLARRELDELAEGRRADSFVQHFGKSDGLGTSECAAGMQPTVCKSQDGKIWFATVNGLSVTDPKTLPFNPRPPTAMIEEILLDGKLAGEGHTFPSGLTVPAGSAQLEIHYTALTLTGSEHARFKFMLDGLDTRWVDAGTRRAAYYGRLPPGPYVFRVRAANSDGVWNLTETTLRLSVLPEFWQTLGFRALAITLGGGCLWAAFQQRIKVLERQRAAQHQLSRSLIESQERERQRISRELHDGLGQDLLIIKNRALLGLAAGANPRVDHYGAISKTVSQALQQVREISYNLRPYQLDELGLTSAFQGIFDRLKEASPVQFQVEVESADGVFTPADESHLFRIVQELTNNILKHSRATEAKISLRRQGNGLVLCISDNGDGFAINGALKSARGDGFGLRGVVERVGILQGTIKIISSPNQGTQIEISLPLAAKTAL